jgi:hypothetical protein
MTQTFEAEIGAWGMATRKRLTAIIRGATQAVIHDAQVPVAKGGRMPVDTGTLRGSLQSSLIGSTSLTGPESYVMIAAQMDIGDVAEFGWGGPAASYARHVEYGTRGRPGRNFAGGAAARWPSFVREAVAKAKSRAGA